MADMGHSLTLHSPRSSSDEERLAELSNIDFQSYSADGHARLSEYLSLMSAVIGKKSRANMISLLSYESGGGGNITAAVQGEYVEEFSAILPGVVVRPLTDDEYKRNLEFREFEDEQRRNCGPHKPRSPGRRHAA